MVAHGSRKRWKEDRNWGLAPDGVGKWSPRAFRWDSVQAAELHKLDIYAKGISGYMPDTINITFVGGGTMTVGVKDTGGASVGSSADYTSGTNIALSFLAAGLGRLTITSDAPFNVTNIDIAITVTTTTTTTTTTTGA